MSLTDTLLESKLKSLDSKVLVYVELTLTVDTVVSYRRTREPLFSEPSFENPEYRKEPSLLSSKILEERFSINKPLKEDFPKSHSLPYVPDRPQSFFDEELWKSKPIHSFDGTPPVIRRNNEDNWRDFNLEETLVKERSSGENRFYEESEDSFQSISKLLDSADFLSSKDSLLSEPTSIFSIEAEKERMFSFGQNFAKQDRNPTCGDFDMRRVEAELRLNFEEFKKSPMFLDRGFSYFDEVVLRESLENKFPTKNDSTEPSNFGCLDRFNLSLENSTKPFNLGCLDRLNLSLENSTESSNFGYLDRLKQSLEEPIERGVNTLLGFSQGINFSFGEEFGIRNQNPSIQKPQENEFQEKDVHRRRVFHGLDTEEILSSLSKEESQPEEIKLSPVSSFRDLSEVFINNPPSKDQKEQKTYDKKDGFIFVEALGVWVDKPKDLFEISIETKDRRGEEFSSVKEDCFGLKPLTQISPLSLFGEEPLINERFRSVGFLWFLSEAEEYSQNLPRYSDLFKRDIDKPFSKLPSFEPKRTVFKSFEDLLKEKSFSKERIEPRKEILDVLKKEIPIPSFKPFSTQPKIFLSLEKANQLLDNPSEYVNFRDFFNSEKKREFEFVKVSYLTNFSNLLTGLDKDTNPLGFDLDKMREKQIQKTISASLEQIYKESSLEEVVNNKTPKSRENFEERVIKNPIKDYDDMDLMEFYVGEYILHIFKYTKVEESKIKKFKKIFNDKLKFLIDEQNSFLRDNLKIDTVVLYDSGVGKKEKHSLFGEIGSDKTAAINEEERVLLFDLSKNKLNDLDKFPNLYIRHEFGDYLASLLKESLSDYIEKLDGVITEQGESSNRFIDSQDLEMLLDIIYDDLLGDYYALIDPLARREWIESERGRDTLLRDLSKYESGEVLKKLTSHDKIIFNYAFYRTLLSKFTDDPEIKEVYDRICRQSDKLKSTSYKERFENSITLFDKLLEEWRKHIGRLPKT